MPPYNGSGTYTLTAGQPVVAGTDILDSTFNTLTADLATALSTCVTRDGQSPPTTNLPMGSFKLTGLAAGTAAGHSVRFEQLQTGVNKLITVAGTGDVITGVMTPAYLAYVAGDVFTFVVGSTNTTNVTINIDGLGAKAVTVNGSTALVAGALPSGKAVQIGYDGTRFQLLTNNYVGVATGTLPVANGGTGVTTSTGSGANVLGTSPTLTTPTISSLSSASATALTLQSAGTTAVTIDTSQNVGIGTTSIGTATRLEVRSSNQITDARGIVAINSTNTAATNLGGSISLGGENGQATTPYNFGSIAGRYEGTGYLGYLQFSTTGAGGALAERMRIDSSGNVGIGTSSPSSYGKLVSLGGDNATIFAAVGATNMLRVQGYNSTYVGTVLEAVNLAQSANTPMFVNASEIKFGIGGTERARIDSSGNLLVGASSFTTGDGRLRVAGASGVIAAAQFFMTGTGANSNVVLSNANGQVGTISTNGSATAYNTSSDYRLKNTIAPMTGALAKVALLKPCTYKWKVDGSDGQGFIAHELAEVEPGCVSGEKDATREEEYEVTPAVPAVVDVEGVETTPAVQAVKGTRTVPSYQGVDTSFLVATLTAAIQEAHALIIQLQADVAALKR